MSLSRRAFLGTTGVAGGDCIRVTPALDNTPADTERLATALREMADRGV